MKKMIDAKKVRQGLKICISADDYEFCNSECPYFVSNVYGCKRQQMEMEAYSLLSWHDAKLDPPQDGEMVLCVKQNKKGYKDYCFGRRYSDQKQWDDGWTTGGGCNNVIWWMQLPAIPEIGDDVITETGWSYGDRSENQPDE